jgi:hypothetical protein
VYVAALSFALGNAAPPLEVYEHAVSLAHGPVAEALALARDAPPPDFTTQQGWVLLALRNAFYQLLHAGSFEAAVVDTVMRGGDTDTNAAIAGALSGAVHGLQAIPAEWRDRVLTCRPVARFGARSRRPQPLWPVDALCIAERLLLLRIAAQK